MKPLSEGKNADAPNYRTSERALIHSQLRLSVAELELQKNFLRDRVSILKVQITAAQNEFGYVQNAWQDAKRMLYNLEKSMG